MQKQSIPDVLMVLAQETGHSIIPDDTVTGEASYLFQNIEFEEALTLFLGTYNYHWKKEEGIYYVSRISIDFDKELGKLSIDAEDVNIQTIIKTLSREIGKTILFDALPRETVSIHTENQEILQILNMLIRKFPDYYLKDEGSFYYIRKESVQSNQNPLKIGSELFLYSNGVYSADFVQIRFRDALTSLFNIADKEFSVLGRNDPIIESFNFSEKTFSQMLRLLLELGNSDCKVIDDIYYIVDLERNDILKKFNTTMVLPVESMSVSEMVSLIPPSIGSSSNIKVDTNNNSFILNGSLEEVSPIETFIKILDSKENKLIFHRFNLSNIDVVEIDSLLPEELLFNTPILLEESNAFILQLPPSKIGVIENYLKLIDKDNRGYPIELKYIKAEEFLANPPPSVEKEELYETPNPNILYYTGTESAYNNLLTDLEILDRPTPQIRYEVLVMQVQEGDSETWSLDFNNKYINDDSNSSDESTFIGAIGNLLNLDFDIVSQFGYLFAIDLNWDMKHSRSKVIADTTLNALSGEVAHFQNTETRRYRQTETDPDDGDSSNTGVTREVSSGLIVDIDGWASGDGMITMDVNATISQFQGADGDDGISPTTERNITTHIRTPSGQPVIIGGLMMKDRNLVQGKTPYISDVPILGKLFRHDDDTYTDTELVITIVPYLEKQAVTESDKNRKIEDLYYKFAGRR